VESIVVMGTRKALSGNVKRGNLPYCTLPKKERWQKSRVLEQQKERGREKSTKKPERADDASGHF